jgi:glycosyltransferase involved in cell wall biosynthesis
LSAHYNPVVSVIVPARNEEACLALCLESLIAQAGSAFEVIVVDDASTDRTAEIARSFATNVSAGLQARPVGGENRKGTASAVPKTAPYDSGGFSPRVTVISAPPLPDNWTGKNNAMSAGAKVAKGKWLLFTDADTVHNPGSLARAVAEAEQHGAALLSYSPEQEVRSFWEKAVMPVIFAELATTYPPQAVNDPASSIAAANGQYLMISRATYDAVGGHTKIAGDLLEDVALARLVKRSGRKIFFRYGPDAVRTRMYRSWSQLREGWTKNLALLFSHPVRMAMRYFVESIVLLAVVSGLIQIMFLGPPHFPSQSVLVSHYPIPDRYFALFKWWITGCVILLFLYLLLRSIRRVMHACFPLRLSLCSMLGPPIFGYLLLRSARSQNRNTVIWKGREYGGTPSKTMPGKSPHPSSAGAAYK